MTRNEVIAEIDRLLARLETGDASHEEADRAVGLTPNKKGRIRLEFLLLRDRLKNLVPLSDQERWIDVSRGFDMMGINEGEVREMAAAIENDLFALDE